MSRRAEQAAPSERFRAISDARAWASQTDGREVVVLIEPDATVADHVAGLLARRGVRTLAFASPWRALAHIGREPAAVIVASARLGPTPLREVVQAVKDETALPVLIAFDPANTDAIGPAVIAGGRPLITLPYDTDEMVHALADALPALPAPTCVRFGRLSIVPEWQDAHLDGTGLDLSPIEFRILAELVRRGGRAASREAILAAAWTQTPADPKASVGNALKRLRQKLEAIGVPGAVETVRGVGYRLNAHALAEGAIEVSLSDGPQPAATPISSMSRSTRTEMSSTIRRTS